MSLGKSFKKKKRRKKFNSRFFNFSVFFSICILLIFSLFFTVFFWFTFSNFFIKLKFQSLKFQNQKNLVNVSDGKFPRLTLCFFLPIAIIFSNLNTHFQEFNQLIFFAITFCFFSAAICASSSDQTREMTERLWTLSQCMGRWYWKWNMKRICFRSPRSCCARLSQTDNKREWEERKKLCVFDLANVRKGKKSTSNGLQCSLRWKFGDSGRGENSLNGE